MSLIFKALAAEWRDVRSHHPHPPYPVPSTPPLEGRLMSLSTIIATADKDLAAIEGGVKNFTDSHLPRLRALASAVDSSPLVQLALDLAGVLDPQVEVTAVAVLKALAGAHQQPPAAQAAPAA